MNRKIAAAAAVTVVATLSLAACSGGGPAAAPAASATVDNKPVTLSVSEWGGATAGTTPEFKILADAYHAAHPNVTIELKDYDPTKYGTLLTADLAAGTAPDILGMKMVSDFVTFASGGQLLDVSDVKLEPGIKGAASYRMDGKQYAIPYRIDGNVLYYNKDLFKAAGVPDPDGTWTWADYSAAAVKLKTGLQAAGKTAKPAYMHSWNMSQSYATAQTAGASVLKGNWGYMKPYYEQQLKMQDQGLQLDYATTTANKTTYQGEFGKQQAAMMLMGTWYVGTLLQQQAAGVADKFQWGIAPVPQQTSATAGTSKTPITFGDPTSFAINAKIDGAKVAAAKSFLAFAESAAGATALAKNGITPALTSPAVVAAFFAQPGMPTDALTKFAWAKQKINPQNPPSLKWPVALTALNAAHSAIMTKSVSIDQGLSDAEAQYKNQAG